MLQPPIFRSLRIEPNDIGVLDRTAGPFGRTDPEDFGAGIMAGADTGAGSPAFAGAFC